MSVNAILSPLPGSPPRPSVGMGRTVEQSVVESVDSPHTPEADSVSSVTHPEGTATALARTF